MRFQISLKLPRDFKCFSLKYGLINEDISKYNMMVKNENLIRKLIQTTDNYSYHTSVVVFGEKCAQAAIMNGRNMM